MDAADVNPTPPPTTPIGFSLFLSAPGVDSGLNTVDGRSIFLYEENGLIVGRPEVTIGSGEPGVGVGPVAIVLSVNALSGNFSVNQYLAIQHANPLDPDESALPETFDAGTVFGRVRVQDGDGDVQTQSIDISQMIKIEDDGPVGNTAATAVTATVEEDGMTLPSPSGEGAESGHAGRQQASRRRQHPGPSLDVERRAQPAGEFWHRRSRGGWGL